MKLDNVLLFISPLLLALALTFFVSVHGLESFLSFFIVFDMVISSLMVSVFLVYWRVSRHYEKTVLSLAKCPNKKVGKYRVATVIPVYNEKTDLVLGTAIASKIAIREWGDIFILDDSTDEKIKKELEFYSKIYGFFLIRRPNRKGYKAGAINAWLANYGREYDLLVIMDADQRPMPGFLECVLNFFDDPNVSYVQIPQYYSSLDNTVTFSAYIQQLPFLRVIMRSRSLKGTAFSLGSGTIYRIKHLLSVGGLYEETVTEDIFTSIHLHERKCESVYVDLPFVWRGEAPRDLSGYMAQQNRWCLGNFQLIKKLLNVKLSASALLDYFVGVYYWLHVGLLSIIDVLAPVLFLVFGFFFIAGDPANYFLVYIPVFLLSIVLYLAVMKKYNYGPFEFIFHQGIQFVASLPATMALFEWIFKRRKSFKVTPKGKGSVTFTFYHFYYVLIVAVLILAILIGIQNALTVQGSLLYAYFINLFWASWWLVVSSAALYVSLARPISPKLGRKIAQAYDGLEENVLRMMSCAENLEEAIATHYLQASERFKEISQSLKNIAADSFRHAETYNRLRESIVKSAKASIILGSVECKWGEPYLSKIVMTRKEDLADAILLHEEWLIQVFAQLLLETCRSLLENTEEIVKIVEDEIRHDKILRGILEKVMPNSILLSACNSFNILC